MLLFLTSGYMQTQLQWKVQAGKEQALLNLMIRATSTMKRSPRCSFKEKYGVQDDHLTGEAKLLTATRVGLLACKAGVDLQEVLSILQAPQLPPHLGICFSLGASFLTRGRCGELMREHADRPLSRVWFFSVSVF